MNVLLSIIKKRSVIITAVALGVINMIDVLRACLPPKWLALADGLGTVMVCVLHEMQMTSASKTPTNPQP